MLTCESLAKLPIFGDLDEPELRAIGEVAVIRPYEQGACVFQEGEELDRFHVLIHGTLQITKNALNGKETVLRLIGPGELFGWAAILDHGSAPATARALTPVRVLKIPKQDLLRLLADKPQVGLRLLLTLSERLRDVHEQLHAVVSERARTRLAKLILRYVGREGNPIQTPLPHQVLARMAGITYEESVRIIGEWSHETPPLLAYGRGGRITVLEGDRLATIAEGT